MAVEYSAWVTPDHIDEAHLSEFKKEGMEYGCFEFLRFSNIGGRVSTENENGELLGNSQVFVMDSINEFGSHCYTPYYAQWIKDNFVQKYVTVSGTHGHGLGEVMAASIAVQDACSDEIIKFTKNIGFTGIDLNIEGIGDFDADELVIYVKWLERFVNKTHQQGLKFRFDTVPEPLSNDLWHGVWKNSMVSHINFDYIVVMSYDQPNSEGHTALADYTFMENSVKRLLNDGFPVNKIIVGVPNYGYIQGSANPYPWNIRMPTFYKPSFFDEFGPTAQGNNASVVRDSASGELKWEGDYIFFEKRPRLDVNGNHAYRVTNTGRIIYLYDFRKDALQKCYIYFTDMKAIQLKVDRLKALGVDKFCVWHVARDSDWFTKEDVSTSNIVNPPIIIDPYDPNEGDEDDDDTVVVADPHPTKKGLYYAILSTPNNSGFEDRALGKWNRDAYGEQNYTDLSSQTTHQERQTALSNWMGADIEVIYIEEDDDIVIEPPIIIPDLPDIDEEDEDDNGGDIDDNDNNPIVEPEKEPTQTGLYYAVLTQPKRPDQKHRVLGKWYRDFHGEQNYTDLSSPTTHQERKETLENWLEAEVHVIYIEETEKPIDKNILLAGAGIIAGLGVYFFLV